MTFAADNITCSHLSIVAFSSFAAILILLFWVTKRNKSLHAHLDNLKWASVELARVNTELQNQHQKAQFLAQTEERLRIAREIHDTVGHSLSAVIYQLSALEALASVEAPQFCQRIEKNTDLCRHTLNEIRLEISKIRHHAESGPTWRQRMTSLCNNYEQAIGIQIDLTLGELPILRDDVGHSFCRILQECLTNAYKHGKASQVKCTFVEVHQPSHLLLFHVHDNGCGCSAAPKGNGLKGVDERIRQWGGQLAWQSIPGKGFDLGIDLPVSPENCIFPTGSRRSKEEK